MNDQDPRLDDDTLAFAARVFQVAREGDVASMRGLLDHGLPPNLANDKGDTLLMLAAYNENEHVARLLLERGADPDRLNDKGQTPLAGVTFKGNLALVEALVEHGAAVNGVGDGARGPLTVAAMFDRTEIMTYLLEHGADPDAKDASGKTATDFATSMGATKAVRAITDWKARNA